MTDRILIGEISTAHGIKGFVKLRTYVDNLDLFSATLFIDEHSEKTIKLTLKNAMKDHWLAEVDKVTDRNAAELLRGTKLYIDRAALPEPDEGEYYYADLIGLPCLDANKVTLGVIDDIQNFGAGDLLHVRQPDGKTFYLPFTSEIVLDVGEAITVAVPEGWLE